MKRQARRAAKATGRNQKVDRVVAVHEAGHVVGRILVAESLGWSPGEIIFHVDINPAPVAIAVLSFDRTHDLRLQPVTYGQMLSRPMSDFLNARNGDKIAAMNEGDLTPIIAEMRAAGIDVDGWYRAKSIETIFGPMAEAKLLELPFETVWNAYSSENDLRDIVKYGLMSGATPEQIVELLNKNISLAEHYMARPEVWHAVLALADNLRPGRMLGQVAAAIVTGELTRGGSEMAGAPAISD